MSAVLTQHDIDATTRSTPVQMLRNWSRQRDVARGRRLDCSAKFMPDNSSRVAAIDFLSFDQQRFFSQIQARTYIHVLPLIKRVISDNLSGPAKSHVSCSSVSRNVTKLQPTQGNAFGHIKSLMDDGMPSGHHIVIDTDRLNAAFAGKSKWAVLALAVHVELLIQAHYKQSVVKGADVSKIFKDGLLAHWKEESRHTIIDSIEWGREDVQLSDAHRELVSAELIDLLAKLDSLVEEQAQFDVDYFLNRYPGAFGRARRERLLIVMVSAYRWQYFGLGLRSPRFSNTLSGFIGGQKYQQFAAATSKFTAPLQLH